jgi:translocation and assembly module TamB
MTQAQKRAKPRKRRTIAAILLVLVIGAIWFLNSGAFRSLVRSRVVAELEDVTGGRVELKQFTWQLSRLEFSADDLTIHGNEGPNEKPYVHVDHLLVRLKVLSFLGREIGIRFVGATRPEIHIIVNPDGSTNQPVPKVKRVSQSPSVDTLFQVAIDRMEVAGGSLQWNDHLIPLDIKTEKVFGMLVYDRKSQSFDGRLSTGGALAVYKGQQPFESEASLAFRLLHDRVDVTSLTWKTVASSVEAKGTVTNLSDPKAELSYKGKLDLAEFGAVTGVPEVRGGKVSFQGSARAGRRSLQAAGQATVAEGRLLTPGFRLEGTTASAQYIVAGETLTVNNIVAQVLGGNVHGRAQIEHWPNFGHVGPESTWQRCTATFDASHLNMHAAAHALSTPTVPIERLDASGLMSGKIDLKWLGTPARMQVGMALDIVPDPAQKNLPLRGTFHGSYAIADQVLKVESVTLSTPDSSLKAAGILGSAAGALQLNFITTNLVEWKSVLEAVGLGDIPVTVREKASYSGTLTGRVVEPSAKGHLELADFDSMLTTPGIGRDPAPVVRHIRWDSFAGDVSYSPSSASVERATLRRNMATVHFSGNTSLRKGHFDENSRFTLTSEVQGAQLADIQQLAGTAYPVTGAVNARVQVSGTQTALRGDGSVGVTDGTLYGEHFRTLSSKLVFTRSTIELRELRLLENGSQVEAAGSFDMKSRAIQFHATGENIQLAHIEKLQGLRFKVSGTAAFKATGSGTLDEPALNADLEVKGLTMNGELSGDISAHAVTHGREMQLSARSNFVNAEIVADGTIRLAADYPGQLKISFKNFDYDPFLRAAIGNRLSGHSSANGVLELQGPLRDPKRLQGAGTVTELTAEIEKVKLQNEGPIRFTIHDQLADIQALHVRGESTDLSASGTIGLAEPHQLTMRADGAANLQLFQGFNRDLLSYGHSTLQMQIGGTARKPELQGTVEIADAGISFIDLPNGLSNINGTLVFNENRLQIRSLSARTGGGSLDLSGFISYTNGNLFFDLNGNGREIRLRYPPGISAAADANLRWTGSTRSSLLTGDVTVTRFGVNPKFDFALYLAKAKEATTTPKINPILDNLRLDVHVLSTPELRVETSLAKITGDADLRLRGTVSKPAVLGRVNIVEGDVFFSGTKYSLERGDISFSNPIRIEPVLNIEASARVREYDITLGFHGSMDKLTTTYRSEPPLPTGDIIALLALGRTREDTVIASPTTQTFSDTASNAILGQALNAAISNRVQKLFGVSRIKIDPQVGGPENNPNARLTIEQQVSNNVTLTYITNLSQSAQQIIQAEFNFNRDVSLIVVRDQNGVLGFDVRIRQRKK